MFLPVGARVRWKGVKGLLLLTALALACAGAPAAQADLSWSTQTLSPTGTSSDQMQVATDAAGDAIAVWVENDPQSGPRIVEETRKAGGDFTVCSTPCWVSGTDSDASSPSIAMNASGHAIVTWDANYTSDTSTDATHVDGYAEGTVSGGFGAAETVQGIIGSIDDTDPQAGIDSAGDEFVAASIIRDQPAVTSQIVAYDKLVGDSGFYLEDIDSNAATGAPTSNDMQRTVNPDADPRIAVNPAGAVLVSWTEEYQQLDVDAPYYDTKIVEASYRAAGGAGGDSNSHGGFTETPQRVSEASPLSNQAVPALDSSGNGTVAYVDNNPNGALDQGVTVQVADRAATTTDTGSFTAPTVISDRSVQAFSPDIVYDSSGDALLAWQQYTDTIGTATVVEVASRPSGGSFGTATVASAAGVQDGPEIGVDSQGRETVEWDSDDNASADNSFVEAATRSGDSGAFTTPTRITGSLPLDTADGDPQLSVSAAGQAVIVWHYEDADSNDDTVVQAAIGSLPGSTPPPPPPPPPPPVPNVIVTAAPIQAGQAIVLTTDVGNATALDWHFTGGPANVLGARVGGVFQNSVRLHWFTGSLTAKVTVTSPSGVHTYSRVFKLPALPSDRYSKLVDPAVAKSPRVFATGDTATLLGNTPCGPVTLYSGDQESSGCMRPVNTVADIPDAERGVIDALAASLNLDPSDPQLMDTAVQRLDGYVAIGPDLLNNTWSVNPHGSAKLMSFPGIGALTSSNASLNVGGINLGGLSGGFSLHVDPSKLDIPLGSLPKPSLPDIGGFPLVGDWNIDLGAGDATIDTDLQLPSWLSIGGVPLHIPVKFKATPGGLVLDALNIGPLNANLGPLTVTGLHLTYDRPSDTWTGSGKVCLLTGVCLDMSPPNGEVKIVHGALNYAGATLDFPPPGVPLFTGVNLTNIGFGVGLDPTRLKANAGISVLDLVQLNGELIAAFPTADHPFYLARDEVGNDFPSDLYGQPFHEPTIGAAADVLVNLPDIGYVKLGSGYLLYEVPDFIALGGSADFTIPDLLELGGSIAGAANFTDHTMNLNAEIHACLLLIGKVCAKAVVDISKAPDDGGGAGGCVDVAGFHIGGGVLWKGFKPVIWPFDGCKWSRFKVDVRPSIASAAAATQTIRVRRGAPNPALKLWGHGAAPLVRVTGRGGQALDSTDKGFDFSPGGHIRILRYQGTTGDFTVVGLERAQPGTYTVSTLPGSVPFTEIDSATDQPDAKITADVTGSGERRLLTYDIRNRPDQTVTFWDTNLGGAATKIGHVNGGGKGQLHFATPPGDRRRTIYAQFTLDGLPAERMTVAHYQPPAPTLSTPRDLRVKRTKTGVKASWHSVPGATKYEIVLTDNTTGYQHLVSTGHHAIVLKGIPRTIGGTLTVRALDKFRQSLTAKASFKRLAAPTSRFSKLARCKLGKRKITCTGGPEVKKPKKPVKKKPKKPKKHKRGK
jgi:hypothetical protein